MKKMISICSILLAVIIVLTGCSQTAAPVAETKEPEKKHKACLITSTPRGNEYTDLIWSGFQTLESEGWEVKCIETFETAEHEEQIRALCEEGFELIYSNGDDIMQSVFDLEDEIVENYPDVHFLFLDTYTETTMPNTSTVTIDPFESCFIAGYVASHMSKTGNVGIMLPVDSEIIRRFEYGYYAGMDYANLGTEPITGYTTDFYDTTKGYEATVTMASNYDIDVLMHAAYVSGYGVISACSELQLPCIGVDNWQGKIDPIVFWSAIKSMDIAVTSTAHTWLEGKELPSAIDLNLADGGKAFAEVDLKNLPDDLKENVLKLEADIMSGAVDVFSGEYEEWRINN